MMKCTKPEGCFNWLWRGKEEKRKRLKFWLLRRKKKGDDLGLCKHTDIAPEIMIWLLPSRLATQ